MSRNLPKRNKNTSIQSLHVNVLPALLIVIKSWKEPKYSTTGE